MELNRAKQVHQNAELLFDDHSVDQAIAHLAARVAEDSADEFPLVLCVMNGGLYLTGQLLRHWDFPLTVDYVHATRYRLATLGKDVLWKLEELITNELQLTDKISLTTLSEFIKVSEIEKLKA